VPGRLLVTVDQPVELNLMESYRRAFYDGCTSSGMQNYCGSYKDLAALPSLSFAAMPYCPQLQIADFVAGACRDFVRWCLTGKKTTEVAASFLPLVPAFAKDWNGRIAGRGMRLDPDPGFSVDEKIAALTKVAESSKTP